MPKNGVKTVALHTFHYIVEITCKWPILETGIFGLTVSQRDGVDAATYYMETWTITYFKFHSFFFLISWTITYNFNT